MVQPVWFSEKLETIQKITRRQYTVILTLIALRTTNIFTNTCLDKFRISPFHLTISETRETSTESQQNIRQRQGRLHTSSHFLKAD